MELFDRQLTPIERKLKEFEEKLDELYKDEIPDLADLTVEQKIDLYQKYVNYPYIELYGLVNDEVIVEAIKNRSAERIGSSCAEDIFEFFSQIKPSYIEDFLEFAEYNDDIIDKCLVCISEGDLSTFTGLISSNRKSRRILSRMHEEAIGMPDVCFMPGDLVSNVMNLADEKGSILLDKVEESEEVGTFLSETRQFLVEDIKLKTDSLCRRLPPDGVKYLRNKSQSIIDTFPTDIKSFMEWFYHSYMLFDYEIKLIGFFLWGKDVGDSWLKLFVSIEEKIIDHPSASELLRMLKQQRTLIRWDDDVSDADSSPENADENVPKESERRAMLIPPTWLSDKYKKAIHECISENYLGGEDLGYLLGLGAWEKNKTPQHIEWHGTIAQLHYFCKALYLGKYAGGKFSLENRDMEPYVWTSIAEVFVVRRNKEWQHPKEDSLKTAKKRNYEKYIDSINCVFEKMFKEAESINRSKQ